VLSWILLGAGFAFAAAIQPGPLQAFLVSRVLRHGWKRTLPAALSPLLSDGPIALLTLGALRTLPLWAERALRVAGGAYLLVLAWSAYRGARPDEPDTNLQPSPPRTLLKAIVVNLLNPNPYLGWGLVLGPAVLAAWKEAPSHAAALVLAFYLTMTMTLAVVIAACGVAGRLSRRVQRVLVLASAAGLAGLGMWQLFLAV
jgi:threonine/homoserine/homoserine lactone efflux protein